ncbi:PilN domain-containing protein [Neobacillus vireti]|uniref:PilN domain-containing protein n=1 Tax=Neobacillus vireti TaxID=220686 RepID=UPI002FFFC143
MLVEINLLPQKDPKNFNIVYVSVIAAVLILISGIYIWQIKMVKNDVASLDNQIALTKKIAEKQEASSQTTEAASSVRLLKAAVDWAADYPIQTIPVIRHLNSLLPERGFIQSFAYTEDGTVTISVQFDSSREAAYFLESLKESEWIEDASLSSLTANESEDTANNTTTQTSGQNAAAPVSGQTASGTANTTIPAQSTDSTIQDSQSSTAAGMTNQTNPAGTTISQTNSNSTITGVAARATTTKPEPNILPRYVGQFEIKFNKGVIKKSTDKNKNAEEGVTTP